MDTTDPEITFDAEGVCNHCHRYDQLVATRGVKPEERDTRLAALVQEIKADGEGKPYDCIVGVSGGVDSTYVAWLTKSLGLRPLAVHLDNGWNSELAVGNIDKTLSTLDIDLMTHVINWEEFRDLQLSFLKASTPDGEVPTDHAIFALLLETAAKFNLRHVIAGTNIATEAILPEKWGYGYLDWRYISGIHSQFGSEPLKTYPHLTLPQLAYYLYRRKIRYVAMLNYVDYDKANAMEILQKDLGWIYYGGKHYESIYTRFYQSYYLPRKFRIDKRKAHYSNLICSGQMTREAAFEMLHEPTYPEDLMRKDLDYVLKKLNLTAEQFEALVTSPNKTFENYRNSRALFQFAKKFLNRQRRTIG